MRALLPITLIALAAALWLLRGPITPVPAEPTGREHEAGSRPPVVLEEPGADDARTAGGARPEGGRPAPSEEPPPVCNLELRVVEAGTGAPATSRVTLWRLGLEATGTWTAGDALHGLFEVPRGGALLEDVPPGQYRAVLHGARVDAPHPEPFEVRPPFSVAHLDLHGPRQHRVWLRLYDGTGTRLSSVQIKERYDEVNHFEPARPSWTTPRSLVEPTDRLEAEEPALPEEEEDMVFYGERSEVGGNPWRWIEDDGRGFDLGPYEDPCHGRSTARGYRLRSPAPSGDRSGAAHVGGDVARDRVYVGVLPDPARYLEAVLLPDGRNGLDIAECITVTGGTILLDEGSSRIPGSSSRSPCASATRTSRCTPSSTGRRTRCLPRGTCVRSRAERRGTSLLEGTSF